VPQRAAASTELKPEDEERLLRSWSSLNDYLRRTEQSSYLLSLLRRAVTDKYRAQVIERVYGRYSALREREERAELVAGGIPASLGPGQ
jgi:hypothetical protein